MHHNVERGGNGGERVARTALSDATNGIEVPTDGGEPPQNQPHQLLQHPRVIRGWTSSVPPFVPPQVQHKRPLTNKVPVGLGLRANSPLPRRVAAADLAATYAEDVAEAAANEAYMARLKHQLLCQQLTEANGESKDAHTPALLSQRNTMGDGSDAT